jgi:hypothetical protein
MTAGCATSSTPLHMWETRFLPSFLPKRSPKQQAGGATIALATLERRRPHRRDSLIDRVNVEQYIYYMRKRKSTPRLVREPVQVYLAPDDRRLLDSLARATGLSRAEILRRGIRSCAAAAQGGKSPMLAFLDEVAGEEWPESTAERHDEFLTRIYRSS